MMRLPLHYQILIAMIAGTIVGVLANPGESELEDAQGIIERTDGGLVLTERNGAGDTIVQQSFADAVAFGKRYPKLAAELLKDGAPERIEFTVADRRLHLNEDIGRISINYTRDYVLPSVRSSIVTHATAAGPTDLASRYPFWRDEYNEYASYGAGVPRQVSIWSKFLGDMFLRLLKMITVPLIVTSLVTGVASLGTTTQFGSMFGRTLLYYLVTSMLAISTGLLMVNIIRPGVGAELPGGGEAEIVGDEQSLSGVFVGLIDSMFPENPVRSLAGAEFLAIITFSILLGIFIIRTGGKSAETLRRFFQSAFDVMMHMTMFIISLAPIGVFAFMVYATASQGLEIFKTLAWYMLAVFFALLVHATIVLPLIVKFVAGRSPWEYARAMSPALMTAFSTASSNGTLPLTITCVEERAGISNKVSSFVLPLGATINMDGTALYEAVAVLFIAQATAYVNPDFHLGFGQQIVVAITALLASVGAAGIPHAGLVMMAIVLQAVGLPLEAQGVIIAVDRVLDMCRTSVNVWSDSCGCAVLARMIGEDGG